MTHAEYEEFVQALYRARLSNDIDECMAFFHPHSTFRLANVTPTPTPQSDEPPPALRDQVAGLLAVWDWKSIDIRNVIIDGNAAAVRYQLTTIFKPSEATITTEIVDVLTVDGGKVAEFHQFVDTAAVERVVAAAR
jgi:ketosteroid isomerase-like protein